MSAPYMVRWRSVVASEHGPERPMTRHVLLTLALHMDAEGGSCYPSSRLLANETGMCRRTVEKHLRAAVADGWIRREPRGTGRAWRRMVYHPAIPADVGNLIPHDDREGGVPDSPRPAEGGVSDSPAQPRRGVSDDADVGQQMPLSSSKSSTDNNSDVREVFDHWKEVSGHTRARFLDERKRKIRARLRTYSVDELKAAITNACNEPFYQGQNDRGTRYDWIETLLKNDAVVERHLENGAKTTPQPRTTTAEELRRWEEDL